MNSGDGGEAEITVSCRPRRSLAMKEGQGIWPQLEVQVGVGFRENPLKGEGVRSPDGELKERWGFHSTFPFLQP